MGWAAAHSINRMCVTGELTVRYLQSVPADRELTAVTNVLKSSRRLVLTEGRLEDAEGVAYARARGKFTPLTALETLAVDDRLLYRGNEVRLFDALREDQGDPTSASP